MRKNSTAAMRTSEAERQRVAEFLRDACGEGRLGADELEERLDRLFAGHTVADLETLVWDLPGGDDVIPGGWPVVRARAGVPARRARRRPPAAAMLAILGVLALVLVSMPPEAFVGLTVMVLVFTLMGLLLATVLAPAGFILVALAWLAGRLWRGPRPRVR